MPQRAPQESFVGSSIQFSLPALDSSQVARVVHQCAARGVQLKWFGEPVPRGYTSRYDSWRYLGELEPLPRTLDLLSTLLDMRIPLTFDEADCRLIVQIVGDVLAEIRQGARLNQNPSPEEVRI